MTIPIAYTGIVWDVHGTRVRRVCVMEWDPPYYASPNHRRCQVSSGHFEWRSIETDLFLTREEACAERDARRALKALGG